MTRKKIWWNFSLSAPVGSLGNLEKKPKNEDSCWHEFLIEVGNITCHLALVGYPIHFIDSVTNRLGDKSCLYIVRTPVGSVVIPCVRSISENFKWIVKRCNMGQFSSMPTIKLNRTIQNSRHHSVTCALRPLSIICAAPMFTHSAAPHLERSAVLCWWRCPQSHLVS